MIKRSSQRVLGMLVVVLVGGGALLFLLREERVEIERGLPDVKIDSVLDLPEADPEYVNRILHRDETEAIRRIAGPSLDAIESADVRWIELESDSTRIRNAGLLPGMRKAWVSPDLICEVLPKSDSATAKKSPPEFSLVLRGWDAESGALRFEFDLPPAVTEATRTLNTVWMVGREQIVVSGDGRYLVLVMILRTRDSGFGRGFEGSAVVVWDLDNGEVVQERVESGRMITLCGWYDRDHLLVYQRRAGQDNLKQHRLVTVEIWPFSGSGGDTDEPVDFEGKVVSTLTLGFRAEEEIMSHPSSIETLADGCVLVGWRKQYPYEHGYRQTDSWIQRYRLNEHADWISDEVVWGPVRDTRLSRPSLAGNRFFFWPWSEFGVSYAMVGDLNSGDMLALLVSQSNDIWHSMRLDSTGRVLACQPEQDLLAVLDLERLEWRKVIRFDGSVRLDTFSPDGDALLVCLPRYGDTEVQGKNIRMVSDWSYGVVSLKDMN